MAKAPKSAVSVDESAVSPDESQESQESQEAPKGPAIDQSLPGIFQEATQAWGANPDYWPIWLKNEFHAWKAGGPVPAGDLSEVLGKKKAEKE